VKVVDANVLLYAVNQEDPHHPVAHQWLRDALRGNESIGFPWICLLAFLRLATKPGVFETPLPVRHTFDLIQSWLGRPVSVLIEPTMRHVEILRKLLEQSGTAGNLTTDAHIAALAIEHGAEVVTFDRDFARFGVRHLMPA
jgi:uncharacterized protein